MATTTETVVSAELAAELRGPLLRITRLMRSERVDSSVSIAMASTLATLCRRGPMSAGELAMAECVQPPSMTKLLASLEERGFVRRAVHPIDRRQLIVALTPAGRRYCDAERRTRNAVLARRLGALTDDERMLLHQVAPLLEKIAGR